MASYQLVWNIWKLTLNQMCMYFYIFKKISTRLWQRLWCWKLSLSHWKNKNCCVEMRYVLLTPQKHLIVLKITGILLHCVFGFNCECLSYSCSLFVIRWSFDNYYIYVYCRIKNIYFEIIHNNKMVILFTTASCLLR